MSGSRRALLKSRYPEVRSAYLSGKSYSELSMIYKASVSQIQRFMRDNTPDDEWPLYRPPHVHRAVRSRRMKVAKKSVKPELIMELVDEYCRENDLSLRQFVVTRLKRPASNASHLSGFRSGRYKSMSGMYAARLLRAIGEPVRKDLVA